MRNVAKQIVNVSVVAHRSPFRYPGGKTWLVPYVRQWQRSLAKRPALFAEPFGGGGIVGLSMLFDDLTDSVSFVELDAQVASVWKTILGGEGLALASRIEAFDFSRANVVAELSQERHTNDSNNVVVHI